MLRRPLFYDPENPESIVVGAARVAFLDAITKVAPEVLASLDGSVMPAYSPLYMGVHLGNHGGRAMVSDGYPDDIHPDDMRHWSELRRANRRYHPDMVPLRKALLAWAKSFHLDEDWMMDIALETMRGWKQNTEKHQRRAWATVVVSWEDPVESQPFMFVDMAGWMPSLEARQEFKARVLQKVEAELEQYLGQKESAARAEGWQETPMKRTQDHDEWLVRYQVERGPHGKIARECWRDRNTVKGGVAEAASRIRLTLRFSGGPGRPKHS